MSDFIKSIHEKGEKLYQLYKEKGLTDDEIINLICESCVPTTEELGNIIAGILENSSLEKRKEDLRRMGMR